MTTKSFTYSPSLAPKFEQLPSSITTTANSPPLSLCIGALIFNSTHDRILLIRRATTQPTFPNSWELPGGGIDVPTVSLLDNVVLKVKKETGLVVVHVVREAASRGWVDGDDDDDGREWRKYTFEVRVESAERVTLGEGQHGEWMWASKEDVEKLEMTTVGEKEVVIGELGGGNV